MRTPRFGLAAAMLSMTLAACEPTSATGKEAWAASAAAALGASAASPAPTSASARLGLAASAVAVIGVPLDLAPRPAQAGGGGGANAALEWSSTEPAIATVDTAGRVMPVRAGVTRIIARQGNDAAATLLSVRGTTPIPVRSRRVGTNVSGVAYFATQFPFANMLKSHDAWSLHDKAGPKAGPFAGMTPDGYPTSLAPDETALAAVAWSDAYYPLGRYVILWDGKGKVSTPISRVTVVESGANRLVIEPKDNTGQIMLAIDRTDPSDPVRNIRFLWPGTEATHATQPFTPQFLARTAPFSVLRFMDWGATNNSKVVTWADRARLDSFSWGQSAGVPIEVMIELANTLHVDPWFCIPHQADDDYVTRMATLVRDKLDPSLRAHIEYSNEVWNWGFSQTHWVRDRAKALNLPLPFGSGAHYYAQRSVEIFGLFDRVYGAQARARLVRVLAGQSAWSAFQTAALGWKDTARHADVLAIAPYFRAVAAEDVSKAAATLALTPEQILDQAVDDLRRNIKPQMIENAALARKYGLKLQAYESGPHLTSSMFPDPVRAPMTSLFKAVNRLPRMHDVYTEYYDLWAASGGDTMLQYSHISGWSQHGSWGALEYLTQNPAEAPKYRALIDYIAAHPTKP